MELKQTLLMPKTAFPMRGNLPVRELDIQAFWKEIDLYKKMLIKREDAQAFVLHDGPPYANGSVHMGHALNKTIKDFINRYKLMQGYRVDYIQGWDTHGLPIEQAVTNSGINRKEKSLAEFRTICTEYALKQVEQQSTQFERMGIFTDTDKRYLTLDPEYEAEQIRVFGKMLEKGLIYKGFKTIYWSPTSESALAEAEIEYKDKKSPSIYVAFRVADGKGILDTDTNFIIWTTTPWTLPGNLAIALAADVDYVVVETAGKKYVVAADLLEALTVKFSWEQPEIKQTFKGKQLEGILTQHPLFDRSSVVVLGDHVTTDAGTGVVHTAPGHGEEDFEVGKKYNLGVICPVDEKGVLTAEAYQYEGLFYEKANKVIGEDLEKLGALLKLEFIEHSYPHDWRTKKPIIYRATDQWFASIEKIRELLLSEVYATVWLIPWGSTRLGNMIASRGDWCISRQRAWGVPIPIIYTEDLLPITDVSVVNHIADLFEKFGSNIWFEKDAIDLLPANYSNLASPNGIFTKETDIMDVWFDSGSSHAYITKKYGFTYPVDMYFEGSDQYRGWFNSSLITGIATTGKAPYKSVLSHGFVLDGKGHKMSKSLGNIIDPLKLTKTFGADIIRLWVASVDYQADVRISDEILKQVAESYRKIRNTYRFLLGNLAEFTTENIIPYEDLTEVDQYMMAAFQVYVNNITTAIDSYKFSEIFKETMQFVSNELSAFYLDYAKDILYIEAKDSKRRQQVQTVIYHILTGMVKLLAPIIPHTSEEVWQELRTIPVAHNFELSVFEALLPEATPLSAQQIVLLAEWEKFMAIRGDVLLALEEARTALIVGKSLEAKITIQATAEMQAILARLASDLPRLFIVSKVVIGDHVEAKSYATATIFAEEYAHPTCPRCWNRFEATELNGEGICNRCAIVVAKVRAENK
ncbi:isoleucyl-tRNA synthetase [Erysipelotrichaceae bacterium]|nr:isoleucyl-tRNA synthetase [Erysipelotrichaceae bacterium]